MITFIFLLMKASLKSKNGTNKVNFSMFHCSCVTGKSIHQIEARSFSEKRNLSTFEGYLPKEEV